MRRLACLLMIALAASVPGCGATPSGERAELALRTIAEPGSWTFLFALPDATGQSIGILGFDPRHALRVAIVRQGKVVPVTPPRLPVVDFAWMADSRLLVAFGETNQPTQFAAFDPLNGQLTQDIQVEWNRAIDWHSTTVSPDGRTAFVAARQPGPTQGPTDLFEIDLHIGETRRLTRTPTVFELSPTVVDDHTIAFVKGVIDAAEPEANGSVQVMDLTTGASTPVSGSGFVARTVTSATEREILAFDGFQLGNRASQSVLLIDSNGSNEMRLLDGPFTFPSLYANGRMILVTDTDSGAIKVGMIDGPDLE
jgi:hypothetical protein